jgi:hypothetical protein
MKKRVIRGMFCLALIFPLVSAGQVTPNGDRWNYDDGYVLPSTLAFPPGLTWYWGYINPWQVAGDGFLTLHKFTILNSSTGVLITDHYALNGVIPPLPPYFGIYEGPVPGGPNRPVISGAPSLRETNLVSLAATLNSPVVSPDHTLLFTVSGAPAPYIVQVSSDLASSNWVSVATNVAPFLFTDTVSMTTTRRFYRAIYSP